MTNIKTKQTFVLTLVNDLLSTMPVPDQTVFHL